MRGLSERLEEKLGEKYTPKVKFILYPNSTSLTTSLATPDTTQNKTLDKTPEKKAT